MIKDRLEQMRVILNSGIGQLTIEGQLELLNHAAHLHELLEAEQERAIAFRNSVINNMNALDEVLEESTSGSMSDLVVDMSGGTTSGISPMGGTVDANTGPGHDACECGCPRCLHERPQGCNCTGLLGMKCTGFRLRVERAEGTT